MTDTTGRRVRIESNLDTDAKTHALHHTKIYVGDEDITSDVLSVDWHVDPHGIPTATIAIYAPGLDVEAIEAAPDQAEPVPPIPTLLCLGCLIEQHQGTRTQPNPATAIVGGQSTCLEHLQFADGPLIPGRTPGGIILGNGS